MPAIPESGLEDAFIGMLQGLGWSYLPGSAASPDTTPALRPTYQKTILVPRLRAALAKINSEIPVSAFDGVIAKVMDLGFGDLVLENQRVHTLLVDGVDAEWD